MGVCHFDKKSSIKNLGTYLKLRPKNLGTQNARLSFFVRKFATQIRKSLISNPHLSFIYFIKGCYFLTDLLFYDVCSKSFEFSSTATSLSCNIYSVLQKKNHFTIVDNFHYAKIKSNE